MSKERFKRNWIIGEYLKSILDNAKENSWDNFSELVEILAKSQDEGFKLSNKNSRFGHTYQFKIQKQILYLKPEFELEVYDKIDDLSIPYNGLLKPEEIRKLILKDFEIMTLFNEQSMYMPDKSNKFILDNFREQVLKCGVHDNLKEFENGRSFNHLKFAKDNAELAGRNFYKSAQKYLNISEQELYLIIK